MDLATVQSIISALVAVAQFLAKYGPGLIVGAENIIADLEMAWKSATSGTPITADQQKQIDDALDNAESALQAAVAAAATQDAANAGTQTT